MSRTKQVQRIVVTGVLGLGLLGLGATGLPGIPLPVAVAQQVGDPNPEPDSRQVSPDTSISGVFSEAQVNPNSVRIVVNDRDVTRQSTITRTFFSYRPPSPLPTGRNTVRVTYAGAGGATRTVQWSFRVQPAQAQVKINSITHNADSQPLGPGSTFLATINGTPRSQATVWLVREGRTPEALSAQEVSPGVYVATLAVRSGDVFRNGVVVGRLQRNDQLVNGAASQPVEFVNTATNTPVPPIGTVPPTNPTNPGVVALQPQFTSHRTGDEIRTRGFTLVGQTRPRAVVQIRVTSQVPVFGGVITVAPQTLVNQDVVADGNGRFEIAVPYRGVVPAGAEYRVRAVGRSGNEASAPAELVLVQGR
ncbi:hypothetical protein GlitD10_0886 [Gloeomargarita lithophora Alchichica-D10]|uniref:Uncharacterized protein n=1 Tax=Gloeomargarita lithophora Alchichica-D10 TaxID=1188229 RepID=A0A1J0AB94_9CYAN|nr:hypothetical protein [Gloeomargarita lithophora]APB33204.1 hypothetical protein GlitD10_0886 [Gloeomargarita lithophora Alchichica-D10]